MLSEAGNDIIQGAREAAAISRGELKPARVFSPEAIAAIKAKHQAAAKNSAAPELETDRRSGKVVA